MRRTFVVGDIHGCFDELMALAAKVNLTDEDLLISLGDIVDRGPKSKEVYEYFRDRKNSLVLMGNHERKHERGILSYGQEIVKLQLGEKYEGFVKWLSSLHYYYECADAYVVHAAMEPGISLPQQKIDVLAGSTSGERHFEKTYGTTHWTDLYDFPKPVIYGHHVIGDVPLIKNATYGIDTGCCHGGFLTAIELPGFVVHQVRAEHDYWKEERDKWQLPVLRAKDWRSLEFADIDSSLKKLMRTDNSEALEYLQAIQKWSLEMNTLISDIYNSLQRLVNDLVNEHGPAFSQHAQAYSFSRYLFQMRSGKLSLNEFKIGCKTPRDVESFASALGITAIPQVP